MTVSPDTVSLMALDATVQLTAEVRDQNGNVMAGAAVSWASSPVSVATVSSSGLANLARLTELGISGNPGLCVPADSRLRA